MSITYYSIVKLFFTPPRVAIAWCSSVATSYRLTWSILVRSIRRAMNESTTGWDAGCGAQLREDYRSVKEVKGGPTLTNETAA